jgi:hypothetical protein
LAIFEGIYVKNYSNCFLVGGMTNWKYKIAGEVGVLQKKL